MPLHKLPTFISSFQPSIYHKTIKNERCTQPRPLSLFFAAAVDRCYAFNYCGTQLPSSGYANLAIHLKNKHPGYVADNESQQSRQAG
ncbi:hypothetical protein F442_01976 [Phytophthora nicotianae P10297]|uniref:BED-type domain-containing protein n=3 Tax=Phytophthora nicotianae TaxID=4792 RepID=W3A1N9_PHYNI|nr:hypothetical protein F442_01976 [Phytophthora nicotianae P10297]